MWLQSGRRKGPRPHGGAELERKLRPKPTGTANPSPGLCLQVPQTLTCTAALAQITQAASLPVTMQVNLTSLSSDTARDLSVVSNSGWVSSVS